MEYQNSEENFKIFKLLKKIYDCTKSGAVKDSVYYKNWKKYEHLLKLLKTNSYIPSYFKFLGIYTFLNSYFDNFYVFLEKIIENRNNLNYEKNDYYVFKDMLKFPKKYLRDLEIYSNTELYENFINNNINFIEFYYFYNENEKTKKHIERLYKKIKCFGILVKLEKKEKLKKIKKKVKLF